MRIHVLAAVLLALITGPVDTGAHGPARADTGVPAARAADVSAAPPAADGAAGVLEYNHRRIATFRAELLGRSPVERAAAAESALDAALRQPGTGRVTWSRAGEAARLEIDDRTILYLMADDLVVHPHLTLETAAEEVRQRLQTAVAESREMRDPVSLLRGAAYVLTATAIMAGLLFVLFRLHRAVRTWIEGLPGRWQEFIQRRGGVNVHAEPALAVLLWLVSLLAWVITLVVVDIWLSWSMRQFAYTRPWGERSTAWLIGVAGDFATAIADAIPGLTIAILVFAFARLIVRANTAFMDRIELSRVRLGWLDADTAGPTRRIANFVIWLFALAIAYPYLPGAHSEAFKGLSVLVGLMLSLGASSVVGQALSGFSLMYSRSLRPGEYVRIGDTEGTVVEVGMFATRIHTGMSEEVSIPNTVIVGNPVRNFSRLAREGSWVIHTRVTIGYATPWRQVRDMLLEAARRTPGVAATPAPWVVQTSLADYYVEYRLCAQSSPAAPRSRAETLDALHANVQDVFNENGVQIMSPHYVGDPPAPQIVPPERWQPPLTAGGSPSAAAPDGS